MPFKNRLMLVTFHKIGMKLLLQVFGDETLALPVKRDAMEIVYSQENVTSHLVSKIFVLLTYVTT